MRKLVIALFIGLIVAVGVFQTVGVREAGAWGGNEIVMLGSGNNVILFTNDPNLRINSVATCTSTTHQTCWETQLTWKRSMLLGFGYEATVDARGVGAFVFGYYPIRVEAKYWELYNIPLLLGWGAYRTGSGDSTM